MKKDYNKVLKKLQDITKRCKKLMSTVEKSKYKKEILYKLERDIVAKRLLIQLRALKERAYRLH